MQVVRTILWVLLAVAILAFSYFNWHPVEVTIWDNLVLDTKLPVLVIVSFLLGLVPTWLLHRGTKWRLGRRIRTLENAARAAAAAAAASAAQAAEVAPLAEPEPPVARDGEDTPAA